MLNPYQNESSINPQREDGHRQLANDVYRAIMFAPLNGSEIKVILCIISKTWGYNKKIDVISKSQIAAETGLSQSSVGKAIRSLRDKHIIFYRPSGTYANGSPLNEFGFNKHYDTWLVWQDQDQDFDIVSFVTQSNSAKRMVKKRQKQGQNPDPTKEIKEKKERGKFIPDSNFLDNEPEKL